MTSMNMSPISRGIPRQGSIVAPMSPDQDIAALLSQITGESAETFSDAEEVFEDDTGDIEDLDRIINSMPPEISANLEQTEGIDDLDSIIKNLQGDSDSASVSDTNTHVEYSNDLIDTGESDTESELEHDEDKDNSSFIQLWQNYKKQIIAIAAIFLVIILAGVIVNTAKNKPTKEQSGSSKPSSSAGTTFYADQVIGTDSQTYQDSMTIEKYIVLDRDGCLFVFRGYAENARAFVTAYVDLDTYNLYKTGARVPVLYEHIVLDDKDYYMKVRVNR